MHPEHKAIDRRPEFTVQQINLENPALGPGLKQLSLETPQLGLLRFKQHQRSTASTGRSGVALDLDALESDLALQALQQSRIGRQARLNLVSAVESRQGLALPDRLTLRHQKLRHPRTAGQP